MIYKHWDIDYKPKPSHTDEYDWEAVYEDGDVGFYASSPDELKERIDEYWINEKAHTSGGRGSQTTNAG